MSNVTNHATAMGIIHGASRVVIGMFKHLVTNGHVCDWLVTYDDLMVNAKSSRWVHGTEYIQFITV